MGTRIISIAVEIVDTRAQGCFGAQGDYGNWCAPLVIVHTSDRCFIAAGSSAAGTFASSRARG